MNLGGTVKLNPVGFAVLCGFSFIFILYCLAGRRSANTDISLKELLAAAVNVAEKGGQVVSKFRDQNANEQSKGKTKEGADDLVTDADYKSHCIMYYTLQLAFPSLKIQSEEKHSFPDCQLPKNFNEDVLINSKNERINSFDDIIVPIEDVTVWIDPLDATQEFTERLYQYVTTMVCVAVRGRPVIGIIHQPFEKTPTTSWVWVERGESSDLVVQKTNIPDDQPVIVVSRSHAGDVSKVVQKSMPQAKVESAGGAGYKVLQLIKGKASAYVHTTAIKKWDICAGNAILNRFGGRLSTLDNQNINYSETETEVVDQGILATVRNHDLFYNKLKPLKT